MNSLATEPVEVDRPMSIPADSRNVVSQPKPKVKIYGLLEMTKPAYLTMQAVVFLILIAPFAGSFLAEQLFGWSDHPLIVWGLRAFVGLILLAEVVETLVICRKFKRSGVTHNSEAPPPL